VTIGSQQADNIAAMVNDAALSAARTLAELVPRLARMIASALEGDPAVALSLRQYRILERLSERPHRTTELASISGVSQPTASAAVAALEARGLVRRSADPRDGRATLLKLTDDGRAVLGAAKTRVIERIVQVTRHVDAQDAAGLQRLLPILVDGMNRTRDELRADKSQVGQSDG
jgi:DNA-binding MarR family transcriptional regulator